MEHRRTWSKMKFFSVHSVAHKLKIKSESQTVYCSWRRTQIRRTCFVLDPWKFKFFSTNTIRGSVDICFSVVQVGEKGSLDSWYKNCFVAGFWTQRHLHICHIPRSHDLLSWKLHLFYWIFPASRNSHLATVVVCASSHSLVAWECTMFALE